jgi:hypothetical protein
VGTLARGATALAAGRHEDAFDQLRRMFDPSDPAFHAADRFMGIGSFVDAAVQSGHRTAAAAILGELEALATLTPSPALRLGILYARPILARDDDAEQLYLDTLASELRVWPFLRGRVQLGYGAWLRRRRRIAESRAPLRAARDTFEALGTLRWAERARQELRASGETQPPPDSGDARRADPPGASDRKARRLRAVESRHQSAAVPLAANRRLAPVSRVPQARDHVAIAARRRLADRARIVSRKLSHVAEASGVPRSYRPRRAKSPGKEAEHMSLESPDTIVLIHGLWMSPLSWENWTERYSPRGYRVLAPSWPGMGVSIEQLRARTRARSTTSGWKR